MSSAQPVKKEFTESLSLKMSLKASRNSKGPNINPCGTPEVTLAEDEVAPRMATNCKRSERQLQNHDSRVLVTPAWVKAWRILL